MDFYENIWYSKNKKEIKENKYLIMLNRNQEELKEMAKDNVEVRRYMDELNKLNKNPEFIEFMSAEEDERIIFNSRMRAATEQGIRQRNIEIAHNLLKQNIDVNIISTTTGLSISQVLELKNNKN